MVDFKSNISYCVSLQKQEIPWQRRPSLVCLQENRPKPRTGTKISLRNLQYPCHREDLLPTAMLIFPERTKDLLVNHLSYRQELSDKVILVMKIFLQEVEAHSAPLLFHTRIYHHKVSKLVYIYIRNLERIRYPNGANWTVVMSYNSTTAITFLLFLIPNVHYVYQTTQIQFILFYCMSRSYVRLIPGRGRGYTLLSDSCKRLCVYFQGPLVVIDRTTSIGERAQETGKEKCELISAQTLAPLVNSLIFFCFVPNFCFPIPHARCPLPLRRFRNIYSFFLALPKVLK